MGQTLMTDGIAARSPGWHATTILMVRKGGRVVIGGDGQVSMGQTVVKSNARKVRRLAKGEVIAGFAGATADAFTLFERLEASLNNIPASSRALVSSWRKTGAPISISVILRHYFLFQITRPRFY